MIKSFSEFLLSEGIHDPARRKAIFIAGGPGSGKTYVSRKTTQGLGFKNVNSDELFEKGMHKHGMESTPDNIYSEKGQAIRNKAKSLTQKRMHHYVHGRLGLVIDGTGKDPEKIQKQSEHLRRHGYDTHMLFVNTSLETAQKRNMQRARTLPAHEVEHMHKQVQSNIGHFQSHFGNDKMHIIDNNDSDEAAIMKMHKKIRKIAASKVENPIGKKEDSNIRS